MDPGLVMVKQDLGQGRETVRNLILDNPELAQELETKIMEAITGKNTTE